MTASQSQRALRERKGRWALTSEGGLSSGSVNATVFHYASRLGRAPQRSH